MSRAFNSIFAIFTALLLALLVGGCETKTEEAAENVAVENAVEADVNAADTAVENAVETDVNAVENVGNAIDVNHNAAPQPAPPPPPATDTGPDDESEEGLGAFVQPDDMEVDKWYTLDFVAAPTKERLEDESEGRELTPTRSIYVAPIMRVTLLADRNFEFAPLTPDVQMTGRDKTASWQWNIKPLTDGVRTLSAKVEVLRRLPDGSLQATESRTRRVDVTVKIGTWKGFLIALKNAASLGDALGTLFSSWRGALVALGLLIGAASGVWIAIKNWGKPTAGAEPN